jgi:FKBP-type peptidyl-prolyl cis-trans isomerase FkpA
MKKPYYFLFAVLILVCCRENSKYPGFSKSRKGFYYQLKSFGESDLKPKTGDYITVDINYQTMKDSLFFEGRRKIKLAEPAYKGAIEDCFKMLRKDESAVFILPAEPFFKITLESDLPEFIKPGQDLKISVRIIDIQSEAQYENEKQAFLNWINDFGDYEKVILQQYLSEKKMNVKPDSSGIFCLVIIPGTGPQIELGDTITINYEGRFLNGKFFDSTKRRNSPFQFVYGTEWQVIKGIEKGLAKMREGEKALFILPSELAFGQTGSSTGIVPPFTSLIYEIEVLKVNKGIKTQ